MVTHILLKNISSNTIFYSIFFIVVSTLKFTSFFIIRCTYIAFIFLLILLRFLIILDFIFHVLKLLKIINIILISNIFRLSYLINKLIILQILHLLIKFLSILLKFILSDRIFLNFSSLILKMQIILLIIKLSLLQHFFHFKNLNLFLNLLFNKLLFDTIDARPSNTARYALVLIVIKMLCIVILIN